MKLNARCGIISEEGDRTRLIGAVRIEVTIPTIVGGVWYMRMTTKTPYMVLVN